MKVNTLLVALAVTWVLSSCEEQRLQFAGPTSLSGTGMATDSAVMYVRQIDPLLKVFKTGSLDPNWLADTAYTYRGGFVNLHFVVVAGEPLTDVTATVIDGTGALTPGNVGWVRQVGASHTVPGLVNGLYSADRTFPDAIIDDLPAQVNAAELLSFWVTIPISPTQAPGVYTAKIQINATSGGAPYVAEKEFDVRVYPVTATDSRLFIANWFYPTPENYAFLNNGVSVPMYSSKFWELSELVAQLVGEYKQNVAFVNPLVLTQITEAGGVYSFDFTYFDQMVNLFKANGNIQRIAGAAIASRLTGVMDSDYGIWVPDSPRVSGYENTLLPITDAVAQSFLSQFMDALTQHLITKGWFDEYYQHVADEPVPGNATSYTSVASMVKTASPNMKIIEAVMTPSLGGLVDVYAAKLDHLHADYSAYQAHQSGGAELWYYTCNEPTGTYANRFVEQQLSYMRVLHWLNFKYGVTGYLHWSLFNWPIIGTSNVFSETSGTWLPGGDAYMVYPGLNKFYSSIRYEQMREGIMDYELLSMLKEKDAARATQLVNQVVFDFDSYETNVSVFQSIRKELLEALSY